MNFSVCTDWANPRSDLKCRLSQKYTEPQENYRVSSAFAEMLKSKEDKITNCSQAHYFNFPYFYLYHIFKYFAFYHSKKGIFCPSLGNKRYLVKLLELYCYNFKCCEF